MTRLQDKAMLCAITISRWQANKLDKKISSEVERAHGVKDVGKYTKALVDPAHLKPLISSASAIRKFHYTNTSPWEDEGARLLPSRSFDKFTDGFRALVAEDERLRRDFFALYPSLLASAPQRLGAMFNAQDFPDVRELPAKFDVKLKINAVPDAEDFRVEVAADAVENIRASIRAENDAKFQTAMKSCYERLHKVVSHISTTLKGEDPRIFDTLVTNAQNVVECLVDLNLADDPVLEQLRLDLAAILPKKAAAFKNNPALRKRTADQADEIIKRMQGYV